jgi:hypothetical protein
MSGVRRNSLPPRRGGKEQRPVHLELPLPTSRDIRSAGRASPGGRKLRVVSRNMRPRESLASIDCPNNGPAPETLAVTPAAVSHATAALHRLSRPYALRLPLPWRHPAACIASACCRGHCHCHDRPPLLLPPLLAALADGACHGCPPSPVAEEMVQCPRKRVLRRRSPRSPLTGSGLRRLHGIPVISSGYEGCEAKSPIATRLSGRDSPGPIQGPPSVPAVARDRHVAWQFPEAAPMH